MFEYNGMKGRIIVDKDLDTARYEEFYKTLSTRLQNLNHKEIMTLLEGFFKKENVNEMPTEKNFL